MKSRQKNWRESRSRETEVGEKIAGATLYLSYFIFIFLIRPLLEARAEIQKYFHSIFGSNENFKICF